MNKQTILRAANELGADIVGACDLGYAPIEDFPNMRYAVSLGIKLSDAVFKTIDTAPSFVYFQHYRTANTILDTIAFNLARQIENEGYLALPVAASQSLGSKNPYNGIVPHKTAAVLSGLGFVGKSGLFLSNDYGSKIRLATVLTDLPLFYDGEIIKNGCGDCTLCRDACPAGAIYGTPPTADGQRNFDAEKCSRYMKEHFQSIGRGSVCGICIKACPKNKL